MCVNACFDWFLPANVGGSYFSLQLQKLFQTQQKQMSLRMEQMIPIYR